MRVCYSAEDVRAALECARAPCSSTASSRARSRSTSTRSATARRRTSPRSCSTSRRRASTRATRPACCRRRRSGLATSSRPPTPCAASAPALGVVGLLNVQLARRRTASVYVLEANPRASRTVPFASKATGVNLVEAACRLAAGERVADLGLPPEHAPAEVSVKAAVLPFARFPGSDPGPRPGDALDRRGDGERSRPARPRSRRPSVRPDARCRRAAPRSSPSATTTRPRSSPIAARLAELGFRLVATAGTAAALAAPASPSSACARSARPRRARRVVDLIRRGRCDLVVNTPAGSGARGDGYRIREAALVARVPCITTLSGRRRGRRTRSRTRARRGPCSLQERIERR